MGAAGGFGLGFQGVPDERMDRTVAAVDVVLAAQVLLNLTIASKAPGVVQARAELTQSGRRERTGFAWRPLDRQESQQTTDFVEGQPGADGVPMHSQQLGEATPGSRLPTGQQVQGLQPLASLRVVFRSQVLL